MVLPLSGSNSAGRVRPCQGRCRRFESGLPLQEFGLPRIMIKYLLLFSCAFAALAQDYKLEPIANAAPDLPAAYASVLDAKGYRIVGPSGPWCEIWFRKSLAVGAKPSDAAITLPIAQGTLLGILRFPGKGAD